MEEISININQVWMTKNLDVDRFRNGDIILETKTDEEWRNANRNKKPAWCYYENNSEYGKQFGKLYNWYAVNDSRGLAPEGWRIPTLADFQILKAVVNNNGNALKAVGQGKWYGIGTNTIGFSALLAGCRYYDGIFKDLGYSATFWSSTEYITSRAYYLDLNGDNYSAHLNDFYKDYGFSVRCVKD